MRVRISNSLLMVIALSITGSLAANADTVNGGILTSWTGPGAGTTLGTAGSPTFGSPYWNGNSGDGGTANIGWCLAGGGNCTLPGGPIGHPQYYSGAGVNTPSNAPGNMWFSGSTTGGSVSTLVVSLTSQQGKPNGMGGTNGIDSLFYYLTNGAGMPNLATLTFLFNAAAPPSTTAMITVPAGDGYGFELVNAQPGGPTFDYFMDENLNTPNDVIQHFAIFQQSTSSFYVGAEDGFGGGDFDYNDMIIHLTPAGVPEPASMGLLGGSLLLLGGFIRRRNRKAAGK